LRLSRLTGDLEWDEKARVIMTIFADTVSSGPTAHSFFLSAIMFYWQPSREAVIAGSGQDDQVRQMRDYLQKSFLPDTVVLYKEGSDEELHRLAPFTVAMTVKERGAAAYVCEGFACQQPVTNVDSLRMIMQKDVKEKTR